MLAVRIARLSTEVYTMSGLMSASSIRSPPARASFSPFSDRSTSTHPVNRPSAFHTLSPCRSSTSFAMQLSLLAARRVGEVREGPQVGKALPAFHPPVPFALDRRFEPDLEGAVEVVVGVRQHAAEDAVDLLRRHRRQRQPAHQMHVASVVQGEVDGVEPAVLLQQPAVELGVVLIRPAAEEGLDVQGLIADDQPRHRRQLVTARQLDEVPALAGTFVLEATRVQRLLDHPVRIALGTAHRDTLLIWRPSASTPPWPRYTPRAAGPPSSTSRTPSRGAPRRGPAAPAAGARRRAPG